jgi:hypothetical protein
MRLKIFEYDLKRAKKLNTESITSASRRSSIANTGMSIGPGTSMSSAGNGANQYGNLK